MKMTGFALTSVGLLLFAFPVLAQDAAHGEQGYKLCASCHGFKGEGNALVNAPALAGQDGWYLDRQIRNFRDGIRGYSPNDETGQIMAGMVRGLETDEAIADIVAYIAKLPPARPAATVQGDAEKGARAYATCVACHGQAAEGNGAVNAPSMVHTPDWYLLSQLQKFKNGDRGKHSLDIFGMQMAPMASVLPDEQAMKDVVSYIASLNKPE